MLSIAFLLAIVEQIRQYAHARFLQMAAVQQNDDPVVVVVRGEVVVLRCPGHRIDYHVAVSGGLRLIPTGEARKTLADDYARMVEGGILPDDTESFDQLMEQCVDIEEKVNASMS